MYKIVKTKWKDLDPEILFIFLATFLFFAFIISNRYEPYTAFTRLLEATWTLCWGAFACRSYRDRSSGFPPQLISLIFAWEFFALYHYLASGIVSRHVLVHDFTWCSLTTLNLYWIWRFNKREFTLGLNPGWFWPKFFFEQFVIWSIFIYVTKIKNDFYTVPHLLGPTTIPIIAALFLNLLLYRDDMKGQSFYGNVLRIIGGHTSLYVTPDSTYTWTLRIITIFLDIIFVFFYLRKAKKLNFKFLKQL